ncbi:hypothetical protein L596_009518 [Steinernema carpocapsae]|uniref:Uncharacterized protein n=1 Tax=Steinernema carpocapsae TaxID=34508 RepID=A0A4U5PGW2_STECR|nr:hypothetical protein L596_009518 [Steinernema carpocapsae]
MNSTPLQFVKRVFVLNISSSWEDAEFSGMKSPEISIEWKHLSGKYGQLYHHKSENFIHMYVSCNWEFGKIHISFYGMEEGEIVRDFRLDQLLKMQKSLTHLHVNDFIPENLYEDENLVQAVKLFSFFPSIMLSEACLMCPIFLEKRILLSVLEFSRDDQNDSQLDLLLFQLQNGPLRVVTNVDAESLSCYSKLDELLEAFFESSCSKLMSFSGNSDPIPEMLPLMLRFWARTGQKERPHKNIKHEDILNFSLNHLEEACLNWSDNLKSKWPVRTSHRSFYVETEPRYVLTQYSAHDPKNPGKKMKWTSEVDFVTSCYGSSGLEPCDECRRGWSKCDAYGWVISKRAESTEQIVFC